MKTSNQIISFVIFTYVYFSFSNPELLFLYVFYSVFSNFINLFLINKRARMGPLLNSIMNVTIVLSRLKSVWESTKVSAQIGNIKDI